MITLLDSAVSTMAHTPHGPLMFYPHIHHVWIQIQPLYCFVSSEWDPKLQRSSFFIISPSVFYLSEALVFMSCVQSCLAANMALFGYFCCSRASANNINTSPRGQYDGHFADDVFKWILLNEKFCILIQISLSFVPERPIDNKWALVHVMAWRGIGDKPFF